MEGLGKVFFHFGFHRRIDNHKVTIPFCGHRIFFVIPDASEISEYPRQWVVAVEDDRTLHLVAIGLRFGSSEDGGGEFPYVF